MGALLRIMQCLPLAIALAVLAAIIFFVVSYTQSPNRAKEVLINVFTVLNSALCIVFGLICAYCALEGNQGILEFFGMFLIVALIALAITRICRAIFVKHHPNYQFKRLSTRTGKRSGKGKKQKTGTYDEWE